MGFATKNYCSLLYVMVLLPVVCYSHDDPSHDDPVSRATYYGSPDCYGTASGACGYKEFGRIVNDGRVTGVSKLFRDGIGCGACYQVRCRIPKYCSDDGVKVVVTDYGEGDRTDFILSTRAYASMASSDAVVKELFAYGVVDVEYRRIPCQYAGHNLVLKIHEHSKFPDYLAIVFLFVAGQNDIIAVEVWQPDHKQWRSMRRAFGAVFDTPNPPSGSLTFRILVIGSAGVGWVVLNDVVTSYWKPGLLFDTTIQLT